MFTMLFENKITPYFLYVLVVLLLKTYIMCGVESVNGSPWCVENRRYLFLFFLLLSPTIVSHERQLTFRTSTHIAKLREKPRPVFPSSQTSPF
jgi:hypothetical protein